MSPVKPLRKSVPAREAESKSDFHFPTVAELMTPDPVSLSESDTLKELADLLKRKSIRHVPVTRDGELVGLVTQRDFLTISVSKLAHLPQKEIDELYSGIKIGDIMGRKVATVAPETPLGEAAQVMFKSKFGCLPVVSEGELVGILTEADFVRAFMDFEVRFKER